MAHAISFSAPSSFACSCAPMKCRGLTNEMQPARHDGALQAPPWHRGAPSFYWQYLWCCGILLYCFISKPTQARWLFTKLVFTTPLCYRPSFRSAYGHHVADLIHKVLFYMDHSYFCMGLPLLVIPAGGRGGWEAAACSWALGVSWGSPTRRERGLHATAAQGCGWPSQPKRGGMGRVDAYFWDSRGCFSLALRCYQHSLSLWLYKWHALA